MGQLLHRKEIIAIGGGKGGTGKSFFASNLGVVLAKNNSRTLLIDADLGGANLHTCLGVQAPPYTLSDFVQSPSLRIEDVVVETPLRNLRLISGAQDILDIANPKYTQKVKLQRAIQSLDVEYIILDLGAGTTFNTLDFFLMADKGIVVVVPEPTSIENAYRFIKAALSIWEIYSTSSAGVRNPKAFFLSIALSITSRILGSVANSLSLRYSAALMKR